MSDTKEKALDYLKSNAEIKEIFATKDGVLFTKKSDAVEHAKTVDADNPAVETYTREETVKDDSSKLSPAEKKALKDAAIAEYKELYGTEPDSKLSGVKIQELNDAKKAELANAKN